MPWSKGQSGNIKGRPRRSEEEKQQIEEYKKLLLQQTPEALKTLVSLMRSLDGNTRYKACTYILDKTFGSNFVALPVNLLETDNQLTINLVTTGDAFVPDDALMQEIRQAENGLVDIENSDW